MSITSKSPDFPGVPPVEVAKPQQQSVATLAQLGPEAFAGLFARLPLRLQVVSTTQIPGSFWGAPEAGLLGDTLFAQPQTPAHSVLHECAHYMCMDSSRRAVLDTNAGGDELEESAVCYLQILLANEVPGLGAECLMADMDRWGYSFRLGSTAAWFANDANDAQQWLLVHDLLVQGTDARSQPSWCLRA